MQEAHRVTLSLTGHAAAQPFRSWAACFCSTCTHGPFPSQQRVPANQCALSRPAPAALACPAEHELDYNVVRGGHEKAVIALYSCSGGVVSCLACPATGSSA